MTDMSFMLGVIAGILGVSVALIVIVAAEWWLDERD